jgi:hypothetical protein
MQEQLRDNLHSASSAIAAAHARIALLRAAGQCDASDDIARELHTIREAEQVRHVAAFQALRAIADEQASELIALNGRRRELVASLTAFLELDADGIASLQASGALAIDTMVTGSGDLLPAAIDNWKARLNELLTQDSGATQ